MALELSRNWGSRPDLLLETQCLEVSPAGEPQRLVLTRRSIRLSAGCSIERAQGPEETQRQFGSRHTQQYSQAEPGVNLR